MRETVRRLRNMQRDIDELEVRVDRAIAPDALELFCKGLEGDGAAAERLRALGAEGRAGHLHEALDAILEPLEGTGGSLIEPEDMIRPEA